MMRFERGVKEPDLRRALRSAFQTLLIGAMAAAAFAIARAIGYA